MVKRISAVLISVIMLFGCVDVFALTDTLEMPVVNKSINNSNTGTVVVPENTVIFDEKYADGAVFEWDWTFTGTVGHQAVYFTASDYLTEGKADTAPIVIGADGTSFKYCSNGWKNGNGVRSADTYKAKVEIDLLNQTYSWYMNDTAVAENAVMSATVPYIDAVGIFDAWENTDRHRVENLKVDYEAAYEPSYTLLTAPVVNKAINTSNTGEIVNSENISIFPNKYEGVLTFVWDWQFNGAVGHQAIYLGNSSDISSGTAESVPIAIGVDGTSFKYYENGWKTGEGERKAAVYTARLEIDTVKGFYSWYMNGSPIVENVSISSNMQFDCMGIFDAWNNTDRHKISSLALVKKSDVQILNPGEFNKIPYRVDFDIKGNVGAIKLLNSNSKNVSCIFENEEIDFTDTVHVTFIVDTEGEAVRLKIKTKSSEEYSKDFSLSDWGGEAVNEVEVTGNAEISSFTVMAYENELDCWYEGPFAKYYSVYETKNGKYLDSLNMSEETPFSEIELYRYGDLYEEDECEAISAGLKLKDSGKFIALEQGAEIYDKAVLSNLSASTAQRFVLLKSDSWSKNHLAYKIYHPREGQYLGLVGQSLGAVGENAPDYDFVLTLSGLTYVGKATALEGFEQLTDNEKKRFVEIFTGVGPDSLLYNGDSSSLTSRVSAKIESLGTLTCDEQTALIREIMDLNCYNGQTNKYSIPTLPGAENITAVRENGVYGEYDFWRGTMLSGTRYDLKITGDGNTQVINLYVHDKWTAQQNANSFQSAIIHIPYPLRRYLKNAYIREDVANSYNCSMNDFYMRLNWQPEAVDVAQYLCHELGHSLDQANNVVGSGNWASAIASDIISVSGYGDNSATEDFAEFSRLYFQCYGNVNRMYALRQVFPARYKIFAGVMESVGYGDIYENILEAIEIKPMADYEIIYMCDGKAIGEYFAKGAVYETLAVKKGEINALLGEDGKYMFIKADEDAQITLKKGEINILKVECEFADYAAGMLNAKTKEISVPESGFEGRFAGWGNARGTVVVLPVPKNVNNLVYGLTINATIDVSKWHCHNGGKGGKAIIIGVDANSAIKAFVKGSSADELMDAIESKDTAHILGEITFTASNDNVNTTKVSSTVLDLDWSQYKNCEYVAFVIAIQDMTITGSDVSEFYEGAESGMTTFGDISLSESLSATVTAVTGYADNTATIFAQEDMSAVVVFAAYDENDVLISTEMKNESLKAGVNSVKTTSFSETGNKKIRVMIWDNIHTMKPVGTMFEK